MDFDTLGNRLTDGQKSYFKDTKIKDGDRLIACQHVTSSPEFDSFDINKSRNGSDFGIGFYFSVDDSVYKPLEGQRKMLCYLNITKPMTEDSHYVSDELWAELVNLAWADEDYKPIGEYRLSFSDKTPDADNYKMLCKIYGGDRGYFLDCVNKVLGKAGVDGAWYKSNCIVAFRPEQIKRIDNANPTASRNMSEELDAFFEGFWK